MEKTKAPKRTRAKVAVVQTRSRVTCWLSAEACHKLELAVIDRKRKTGNRNVEFGDIIETMLLNEFSHLTLVDRTPRPAAEPDPSSNGDLVETAAQPEN